MSFARRPRLLLALLAASLASALAVPPLAAAPIPVGGRVVTSRGEPVAGARVALVPQVGSYELGRLRLDGAAGPAPAASGETDRSGRFELAAPEAGIWTVTVEARGHLPLEYSLEPLLDATEIPDAVVARDEGLDVRIADEAGRPLAARLVAWLDRPLFGRDGRGWRRGPRLATAGADGAVRLPRGEGERLRVWAAAPGRPPVRADLVGRSGRIVLGPGVPRPLRALDERGRPVPDALTFDHEARIPLGRTDAEGRWTAAVPPRGELALRLQGPGGLQGSLRLAAAPAAKRARSEPQGEPTARLAAPLAVSGRVIDREGRRPLPGALVWVRGTPSEAARTDKAGAYVVRLPAGGAELVAAASGYLVEAGIARPRSPEGPTFALAPAGAVEGVVVDAAGRPVAGADVTASPRESPLRTMRRRSSGLSRDIRASTRASAAGRFRLAGLLAGVPYEVTGSRTGLVRGLVDVEPLRPQETRAGLRLVLAAGRRGVGMVVDRAGQPIAGARVSLASAAGEDMRRTFLRVYLGGEDPAAWTDAAGRFELSGLAPGRYDLSAEAEGFAPVQIPGIEVPDAAGPAGAGPAEVGLGTITLSPGAVLEGLVADAAGQPVAGAEVRASLADMQGQGPAFLRVRAGQALATVLSEADGRFTVRDLRPGAPLHLAVDKPGYAAEMVQGVTAPAAAPVRITLRRAGRVSGRVLDAARKPVADAYVSVQPGNQDGVFRDPTRMARASTDAEGRFEAEEVEPGEVAVEASAEGHQTARLGGLALAAGGELSGLELVLEPGATVEGRVLAAGGLPVAGAEVSAGDRSTGGFGSYSGMTQTDGDGRYWLTEMPAGPSVVSAVHPDHGRTDREIDVRPGANPLDLAFEPGLEVSGRVVDVAGEPVAGVELRLIGQARFMDAPETTSAADGSFSFSAVSPGSYRLMGRRGAASVRSEAPVEVRDSPVTGVVLRLELGRAVLTGSLRGLPPADLGGVRVQASGTGGSHQGRVDFRGTYSIDGLAPGEWEVTAQAGQRRASGKIAIPEGSSEATLDLDFTGGVTLTGTATRGGEPLGGAEVFLTSMTERDHVRATTDPEGAFRFEGVSPGRYHLDLHDARSGLRHSREVDLAADRHLSIALQSVRVAGFVRDAAGGKPIADATVELNLADPAAGREMIGRGMASRTATSDSRGFFSLGEVAEGRVRIVASSPGYARAERTVDLGTERADELDLQLTATEGIRFEAFSASGVPAGRVYLSILDGAGRTVAGGSFETTTGGEVRVSTVPAGSWEMLIRDTEGAVLARPVTAPGSLGRIHLPPGGRVEVIVPDLEGSAVAATARVVAPDGRPYRAPSWGELQESWPVQNGRARLFGLPVGRSAVTVTAADGRTWTGTAEVTPGGTAQVTLR